MSEISREEAKKSIEEKLKMSGKGYVTISTDSAEMAIEALSQPEIIHCAECKYFTNLNDKEFALCDRAFTGMYVDADGSGFCSWAERRTDGTEET